MLISSKRKPNLIETDHRRESYNSFSQNFIKNNNIKHYYRNTYLGAVFAPNVLFVLLENCLKDLLMRKEKATGLMFYQQ